MNSSHESKPENVPNDDNLPLAQRRCSACEGGIAPIAAEEARNFADALVDWELDETATTISRKINCKTFAKAVQCLNQIAEIAEDQQHHPDLHLTGYRHLQIVLTTHAIAGLSENDFIIAAKIDQLLN